MKKYSGVTLVMVFLLLFARCSKSSSEELDQLYTEANTGNEKITVDPIKMEEDLLLLVNEHRSSLGLNTLVKSTSAYKYAEEHNDYMISKNKLSHDNFENRAAKIADEMNALLISENVARYYTSAEVTIDAWINSASHREAMEGDFSHTTLSVQLDKDGRPYFTQIFIKVE
ncbi:MAG: CAP domain-containing protein [Bacteroidota bacterium]|nr:CAP domain-containing protein [Bacteroidota bacterium]